MAGRVCRLAPRQRQWLLEAVRRGAHCSRQAVCCVPPPAATPHGHWLGLRRELAEESGIPHWGRVPALNTNPTFIDDLADAVLEALPYVGSLAATDSTDGLVPLGAGAGGRECPAGCGV